MYNASFVAETMHDAKHFSFKNVGEAQFDWPKMKENRDTYIGRLNKIYEGGLDKLNVTRIEGFASFDKVVAGFEDPYSGFEGSTTLRIGIILTIIFWSLLFLPRALLFHASMNV